MFYNFFLFVIDITRHDLLIIGTTVFSLICGFGILAVAIKNIRVEVLLPAYKFCVEPIFVRRKQNREILEKFDKLSESVAKIEHEVLPNSGSSIKDSIGRIEIGQYYFQSKLRHIDHISSECLFEADDKANITFVNRALCDSMGVETVDLLNRAWLTRIKPEDRERVKNEWKEAIENKIPLDSRQELIDARSGETFLVRVHAQPRLDAQGNLLGFFGHVVETK